MAIFEPIRETAFGPVREYRTLRPPIDFVSQVQQPSWYILFVSNVIQLRTSLLDQAMTTIVSQPMNNHSDDRISTDRFYNAVQVEAIWNSGFHYWDSQGEHH